MIKLYRKGTIIKIIVPTFYDAPDQRTTSYIIDIAKRLGAQLVVLRVLAKDETEAGSEKDMDLFIKLGKKEKVPVNVILRQGDIASVIIDVAEENAVDLIILGLKRGQMITEWINAKAMEKTDIPVLIIPKWVPNSED